MVILRSKAPTLVLRGPLSHFFLVLRGRLGPLPKEGFMQLFSAASPN
jgi:hypothetical protein